MHWMKQALRLNPGNEKRHVPQEHAASFATDALMMH
jgi:hypothetical protein